MVTKLFKKKILFIQPPWPGGGYGSRSQNRWPRKRGDKANRYPLYLCYAATLLQQSGFNVNYIDCVMEEITENDAVERVVSLTPDAIFIEPATPTFLYDLKFVERIKKRVPHIIVIFGGYHVTRFPEDSFIRSDAVDFVVRGELDLVLLNLFMALVEGMSLDKVRGIVFRRDNRIFQTEPEPLIQNLDSLPFPDRNLIPHHLYKEGHVIRTPFTFIVTARGCPNTCSFCLWPNVFHEHRIRYRSISNVIEELEWLISTIGLKEFFIDDGTFNVSKQRVIEFCKALINMDISLQWSCNARVDLVDEEMLYWMKKSRCKLICYGPESASQVTLNRVNKRIDITQSKKAIYLTKKAGITAHANFMVGFPWETKEDIENTIRFAIDLDPSTAQFSLVFPHPGTTMFDQAIEEGWFRDGIIGNWEQFEMSSGPVLKCALIDEVYLEKIISYSHRRFYLRLGYIKNSILRIRHLEDFYQLVKGAYSVFKGKILFKTRVNNG